MNSRNDHRVVVQDAVSNRKKRRREQQEETNNNNNVFQTEDEDDDGQQYYSHIRRIDDDARLAHLAAILPLTTWSADVQRRELVDFRVYLQISVYLAWHHLQQHHSDMDPTHRAVLPDVVQQRLQGCDLQFSLSLHDSQFSPLYAARQLVNVLTRTKAQVVESTPSTMPKGRRRIAAAAAAPIGPNSGDHDLRHRRDIEISPLAPENSNNSSNSNSSTPSYVAQRLVPPPPPMALLGAARSAVTATLSGLSSVYGIPQISGSSTASVLDDKARHPLLARTVPTNAGDARAAVLYLQHQAVQIEHLVVLYVGDDFGTNYHAALIREAASAGSGAKRPTTIRSIQYTTEESMELALKQLKESGIRFVLGILNPQSWKQLLSRAAALDIAGPGTGYTWFLTEANLEVSNPEFALDGGTKDSQDALAAKALHGAGIILIHIPNHEAMDQALQDFRHDTVLQQDFAAKFQDDDDVEAKMLLQNYSYPPVGQSFYQYLYYDAMMALGIAACETKSRDLFTGQELYQQLLLTEFPGVSGTVSFDPRTGTRQSQNFQFRIVNLMMRQDDDEDADAANEDDGKIRFRTQIAALVHPPPNNATTSTTSNNMELVELLAPFVYADSTTRVPVDLNPLVQDWNLITPAFRGVGLTLGLLAMISSMGWMIWTLCHRKKDVVQSSQPFFLVQLCIGTLIMSSAIIPLSLQEPVNDRVLDICCMSIPWLISLGFVTSFSALFSKTWRLRRLYAAGRRCRRITLEPKDVMLPFAVLLTMNLILLVAWSIVAPLTWERVALDNFDDHGRAVESVGSCRATDHLETQVLPFAILILVVNIVALVFATYQAYLAREIPTEFFEAGYVFMSFASLLETFIIGVPLLFIGSTDPNASFLIRSILITISCLAIQLPVFLPKYNKVKTVLEERLNGPVRDRSINVFIDGQQVDLAALSRQRQQEGGLIRRSLRNLFGSPNRGESTTETLATSSALPRAQLGTSLVRRTPSYYQEEELKRRRFERNRSSSTAGVKGSLGQKAASLCTLFETREEQQQKERHHLTRSQSDRPRSTASRSLAIEETQDKNPSHASSTSEVDHSANSHSPLVSLHIE